MEMLTSLPSDHHAAIASWRATWSNAALSTTAIVEADARDAVCALFRAISLDPPATFRVYPSPAAALRDFPRWKSEVRVADSMPCGWWYQLPMYHPDSYWHKWGRPRDYVDLAVRRWPNPNRCWSLSESLPEVGSALSLRAHAEVWSAFDGLPTIDWMPAVVDDLETRFPEPIDWLQTLADENDPTCQFPVQDFIFLGPFAWLVREVACVDFCQTVLGCRVNRAFYDALRSVLRATGLVFTFDRLCILCERPEKISATSILYRDGYEVFLDCQAAIQQGITARPTAESRTIGRI